MQLGAQHLCVFSKTIKNRILSMQQPKMHEGEIEIDAVLVKRLLSEQFPHLANRLIRLVRSTGTVNAIYRLDHDFCVRLPRLGIWAESIDNEWAWLPELAPYLSLNIPKPLARGKPTSWYPYPWAIYHWLEGTPYQDSLISDERQAAYDLANFILELRSIDIQGAPRGGRRPLLELDAATRSAIESSRAVIDTEAVSAAWTRSLESPPWNGNPAWIHGDLLKSNLLVQEGCLCAVIDFGGVGIGDPAADVVPAWSVFNKVGRETFRQALDVDDDTWSRARGYALHQALMIIPYYPETNPEFVAMAKRTVEEILTEFK
jgi:aminoglycoside phosphotransferase (APT) family kinase protein